MQTFIKAGTALLTNGMTRIETGCNGLLPYNQWIYMYVQVINNIKIKKNHTHIHDVTKISQKFTHTYAYTHTPT